MSRPKSRSSARSSSKYWCPPGLAFVQAPTLADMQGACQDEGSGARSRSKAPRRSPKLAASLSRRWAAGRAAAGRRCHRATTQFSRPVQGEGWTYTVFCEESGETPVKTLSEPTLQELFNGNGVQWAIQAGLTLTCYWFNQPPEDGEENSVMVYKWDCAPGTESGRELEYYQGGLPDQETGPCETQHTNIPISLIDGDGEHPTTTQADGHRVGRGSPRSRGRIPDCRRDSRGLRRSDGLLRHPRRRSAAAGLGDRWWNNHRPTVRAVHLPVQLVQHPHR